jgi:hypothetical protein
MTKIYIFIGGILLFVVAIIFIIQITSFAVAVFKRDIIDIEDMEYRTERASIEKRFPDIPNFIKCYWKADAYGKTNFGPTSYWMKGFIILEEDALSKLLSDYEWSAESIDFPRGINPDITGKTDFNWHINRDFQSLILRQRFGGNIYLDIKNGVLYFDVENN